MQRAQSDDKFRHADLRSDPLILKTADRCPRRVIHAPKRPAVFDLGVRQFLPVSGPTWIVCNVSLLCRSQLNPLFHAHHCAKPRVLRNFCRHRFTPS